MKLRLRKYKLSDLERVCELFIDDSVLENLAVPVKAKDISREDESKWLKDSIKEYEKNKPESYKLAIIVEGNYVGSIGIHHIDYKQKRTQIGYWIGKHYWGKGIVTHAIKKFVKHITKKFGFREITAIPFSYNKASQRVLEKAGFQYKKENKKAFKKGKKLLDEKVYVIRQ